MLLALWSTLSLAADVSLSLQSLDGVVDATWSGPVDAWPAQTVGGYTITLRSSSYNEADQTYALRLEVCRSWTRKKATGEDCWEQTLTAGTAAPPPASFRIEGGDEQLWGLTSRAWWSGDAEPARPVEALPGPVPVPVGETEQPSPIESTIRRYTPQLKYCYEHAMKPNESLSGRVEVGWTVDPSGRTTAVHVVEDSVGNEAITSCMLAKIARWSFPSDSEGDVTWPFVFRVTPHDGDPTHAGGTACTSR